MKFSQSCARWKLPYSEILFHLQLMTTTDSKQTKQSSVVIVGGGVFGVGAAIELAKRGHKVHIVDPGPIPNPYASSTDISKLIRPDYGEHHIHKLQTTRLMLLLVLSILKQALMNSTRA